MTSQLLVVGKLEYTEKSLSIPKSLVTFSHASSQIRFQGYLAMVRDSKQSVNFLMSNLPITSSEYESVVNPLMLAATKSSYSVSLKFICESLFGKRFEGKWLSDYYLLLSFKYFVE